MSIKAKIPKKEQVDPFNTIDPWVEQRSPDNDFKTEAHDPNIGRSFVPSDLYRHDQQTVINTIFDYSRTPQIWVHPPKQQVAPSVKFKRLHPNARLPTYASWVTLDVTFIFQKT